MATEDGDIEAGGQAEDAGDTGDAEEDAPADDGDRQAARSDDAGEKPSRKQRKGARFAEEREGRERAERELGELRGRYSGLESQFNEFRQQIERDKQAAQHNDASTQTREKIRGVREQARTFLMRSAQSKDPAEAQKFLDRHDELMDEADDLRAEMREEARLNRKMGEFSQNLPNPDVQREVSYLEGKYPEISENLEAQALTAARFNSLIQKGMPRNRATMEAAITYAKAKLGIGGRSAPSDASRRAYVGTGARDGEGDGGGSGGDSITVEDVKNNLSLKKMAENAFKDDEAPIAYAKFAKMYNAEAKRNGVNG